MEEQTKIIIPEDEKRATIDNIVSILKDLDERRLHLVHIHVKAIAGK